MIETFKRNKAFVFIFLACFVYWAYLFFYSSMAIVYDAVGYEFLGKMIYKEGWAEFFRTGPNREPLYPLSISMSMRLADVFNVSYQNVQTAFQISILFIVQLLALKIMTMCSFKKWTKLLAVFYLGFSPAIVNAGFSLYSEVLVMPFVLLMIIFVAEFWKQAQSGSVQRVVLSSILLAVIFMTAIGVKAVFQCVFFVFMIILFVGAIDALRSNRKSVVMNILLGMLVMVPLVGGFVNGYKYMNKIYNGKFDFTDRYDYLLFGTAYKRVQPLSRDVWLAHFASIPGNNFCESILNKEACLYPQFHGGDALWPLVLPPLLAGISEEKVASKTVQLSFEAIKKNPFQYFFLTFLESLKMGFWESTQIGFVNYPERLAKLFQNKFFKNGLRFIVTLFTYAGLFLMLREIFQPKRGRKESRPLSHFTPVLFLIFGTIVLFTGLYSFFSILSRFALSIAPLYVICMAYFFDRTICGFVHSERISNTEQVK